MRVHLMGTISPKITLKGNNFNEFFGLVSSGQHMPKGSASSLHTPIHAPSSSNHQWVDMLGVAVEEWTAGCALLS
jgi:hypothetical protein